MVFLLKMIIIYSPYINFDTIILNYYKIVYQYIMKIINLKKFNKNIFIFLGLLIII